MTNTLSVTETVLFIKDIMDAMAEKKSGLMNYKPYLNFIKKMDQLDKYQIEEATRLKY